MRKPCSFRLQLQTIDAIDKLVPLVESRHTRRTRRNHAGTMDRTAIIEMAVAALLIAEQARLRKKG